MKKPAQHFCFHGDDVPPAKASEALFHVIPVPLEQSVSYGTGTAAGPEAILTASCQLETLAGGVVPADEGIYTAPPVDCSGSPEMVVTRIENVVSASLEAGAIPVLLGGEHTVSLGAIQALYRQTQDFGVIQFDAHADLRNSYQGSKYSHACVMRRVHEASLPIFQIGTRNYSLEESEYRKKQGIGFLDSETIWRQGPNLILPENFPEKVYISFDLDAFDCSLLPATGTPVPGGLNWYQALWLIEQIMDSRLCLGFDVVELAPIEQLHASSFLAAQLTYSMMASLVKSRSPQQR
ncbi:MAG: agmatinase [Deltaproteobacteria bacterium]|nr:MAG: agmatinase [Deltaproteobacteria bacterium]PIE73438.1 MAG: agmatinase [Deltaproteobacteria bacterium]